MRVEKLGLVVCSAILGVGLMVAGCGGGGSSSGPESGAGSLTSPVTTPTVQPTQPAAPVLIFSAGSSAKNTTLSKLFATPNNHLVPSKPRQNASPNTSPYADPGTGDLNALALQTMYGVPGASPAPSPALAVNTGNAAKQVIAIVDAFGYANETHETSYDTSVIQSDLQAYSTLNGLPFTTTGPTPTLTIATEGTTPGADTHGTASVWETETALDIDMVHAINPNAQILLVLTSDDSGGNLFAGIDFAQNFQSSDGDPVTVVSMSFGFGEFSEETFFDLHFHHVGVTFVASTGDIGSTDPSGHGTGIQWPAACPNVVAVGGTNILETPPSGGVPSSEASWNLEDDDEAPPVNASGGGTSQFEPVPSFQAFTKSAFREIPDVSANAGTPVAIEDNSRDVGGVEGTSIAAPLWAGMIALANAINSNGALNTANIDLYNLAAATPGGTPTPGSPPYSVNYRDINDGGSNGAFTCGPGYDQVTGLGSPIGNILLQNLGSAGQ